MECHSLAKKLKRHIFRFYDSEGMKAHPYRSKPTSIVSTYIYMYIFIYAFFKAWAVPGSTHKESKIAMNTNEMKHPLFCGLDRKYFVHSIIARLDYKRVNLFVLSALQSFWLPSRECIRLTWTWIPKWQKSTMGVSKLFTEKNSRNYIH